MRGDLVYFLKCNPHGGSTSVVAGRSLKHATVIAKTSRYLIPHSSRHPLSTRSTHRAVVFASLGSPLAFAHEFDTALEIRSGVDPCEWMAPNLSN